MKQPGRRLVIDRRKQPTPGLSRYTFFGRRKGFRREIDRQTGGYVDRYSPKLFFALILIVGLNVLDALLTLMILDLEGWEVNPIVRSVMEVHGDRFWIWKFVLVSGALVLLCLHSKFRRVKIAILSIGFIYCAVVFYQVVLMIYQ